MADRDESTRVLRDLIDVCEDGEQGFERCAERVDDPQLKALFRERAMQCRRSADELARLAGEPSHAAGEGGSVAGAVHRGWLAVKDAVTRDDRLSVLEEAERGEDHARTRYEAAMNAPLPPDVHQVVEKQYRGVIRNHDEVKTLRNRAASEAGDTPR